MDQPKEYCRILTKGGVLSPIELLDIIKFSEELGHDYIMFGSRQDIIFETPEGSDHILQKYSHLPIEMKAKENNQNIVCSYLASGIQKQTRWLSSTRYLYVLEQFKRKSKLRINIVDPKQSLAPLFTGHLNFLASSQNDYWYIYIKLPHWEEHQLYPVLVYGWDIAEICSNIETYCMGFAKVSQIFDIVSKRMDSKNNKTIHEQLEITSNPFPYYEGFNKINEDLYWLGLYWRNNRYDIEFLKQVIDLCLATKVGKICITSWKSFIIKPIHKDHLVEWEKILGINGINVRHSSLELNWHLPVADEKALALKKYVISEFDTIDISTFGITFGIFRRIDLAFTTFVIVPKEYHANDLIHTSYDIYRAKEFNPNTASYLLVTQDIDQEQIVQILVELTRQYFRDKDNESNVVKLSVVQEKNDADVTEFWQCQDCFTVTEHFATEDRLPEDYVCEVCDADASVFTKINNSMLEMG